MLAKKVLSILLVVMLVISGNLIFNTFENSAFALGNDNSDNNGTSITDYKTGELFEFGWYPQSKVTNGTLVAALNELAGNNKAWNSYNYYSGTGSSTDGKMQPSNYMRYTDIIYNGNKYRGVVFDTYRPNYTGYISSTSTTEQKQSTNGYYYNKVYWFNYDPIVWRVLNPETGLVVMDSILDSQAYNNYIQYENTANLHCSYSYWGDNTKTYFANNYRGSSIRQWLNNDFYNTAFSSEQQEIILSTTLDNKSYVPRYFSYGSETTTDKVFLLSYDDVLNTNNGFNSSSSIEDNARRAKATEYAKCQGVQLWPRTSYPENAYWMLRSAGSNSDYMAHVNVSGGVYGEYITYSTQMGIRAALSLNPTSYIFQSDETEIGTGTSSGAITHIFINYVSNHDATCTSDGTKTAKCENCDVTYTMTDVGTALDHDYFVEYSWARNGSSCIATATCNNDKTHVITETGTITSDVKVPATCTTQGITTYTALFSNSLFSTQSIDISDIPITGHKWKYSTNNNSIIISCTNCTEEYTVTAVVPKNCKCSDAPKEITVTGSLPEGFNTHVLYETEDGKAPKFAGTYKAYFDLLPTGLTDNIFARCEMTIQIEHDFIQHTGTSATCEEDGCEDYLTCSGCNYTTYKTIPAFNHKYVTTYEWSKDGKSCIATATCQNDATHTFSEKGVITSKVKEKPTCIEMGTTTYTAVFNNKFFNTQTKDVIDINPTGHKEAIKNASEPTCTTAGYSGITYCVTCNALIEEGIILQPLGHIKEIINAKEATETETGYTGDIICTRCHETLQSGAVIPINSTFNPDDTPDLDDYNSNSDEEDIGDIYYDEEAFDGDFQFIIEERHNGNHYDYCINNYGHHQFRMFDVKCVKGGEVVQPTCEVWIALPLPENFNPDRCYIYHVKDDEMEKMDSFIHDNKVFFKTGHFSDFAIVDESSNLLTDIHIHNYNKYNGSTQKYKTTITFYYDIENDAGNKAEWHVDGAECVVNSDGSCSVKQATRDYTIYCQVKDVNGNVVKSEVETIHIKHGIFDMIIGFFRSLFGGLDVYKQD